MQTMERMWNESNGIESGSPRKRSMENDALRDAMAAGATLDDYLHDYDGMEEAVRNDDGGDQDDEDAKEQTDQTEDEQDHNQSQLNVDRAQPMENEDEIDRQRTCKWYSLPVPCLCCPDLDYGLQRASHSSNLLRQAARTRCRMVHLQAR